MNCKWIYIERGNQRIRSMNTLLYKHSLWIGYLFFKWNYAVNCSNHGLWTPNEAFFYQNPKLSGLGRQFGKIDFWAFGVFSSNLSAPILVVWIPCHCFPLINHYLHKKLSLYIQIPSTYLGLGFEFGPQRIKDFAIVVRGLTDCLTQWVFRVLK